MPGRTRSVDARGVEAFKARATDLAEAMDAAEAAGHPLAAAVLAVQCSIACCDMVCGAYLGKRAAGDAHEEAARLLASCGAEGAKEKAGQLSRILELKYAAEYDDRNLTTAEARALVERARRLHGWAVEAAARAPRQPV